MERDTVISINHVSKNFRLPHERAGSVKNLFVNPLRTRRGAQIEVQHALRDISFDIQRGEFFGIVGRNGSGKSTLLKMIAGIYQPTKGKVSVRGRLVPFIELGVGFNPELSGRDNVYLNGALMGFSSKEIDAMYDDIVKFAELEQFMDQKLKNYSSGMQVRLAFSMATRSKADILLIDEVLAVGDADFQRKCFQYFRSLKKSKTTVVFVSHDMEAVREFCGRALLIEDSKIISIGSTEKITRKYSELFMHEDNEQDVVDSPDNQDENRWGNGAAIIDSVRVVVGEYINVNQEIVVKQNLDKMIFGLHVIGADGVEITAMNNEMIRVPAISRPRKGDKYSVDWQLLNIFSDGNYTITLTLIDGLSNTLDWRIDVGSFTIKRAERSTTAVFPPLSVNVRRLHNKGVH